MKIVSCFALILFKLSLITFAERANECTKALPPPIRKALQHELCGPSSPGHTGPARCAATAKKVASSLKFESIVELCRDAESDAPAVCIGKFRIGAPVDLMIKLCAPLGEDIGGSSNKAIQGPSECFTAAPRGWTNNDILWLCQDAISESNSKPFAAECAIESLKHNHFRTGASSSSLVASLCHGSKVKTGPIKCALAVPEGLNLAKKMRITTPESASKSIVSQLCQGALNDWPAKCYVKVSNSRNSDLNDNEKVLLCRDATSLAPATCILSPALLKLDASVRVALCTSNNVHQQNIRDDGGKSFNVVESSGAISTSVAQCAEAAYPMMGRNNGHLLVQLCQGASGIGPSQCLSKAPLTIDIESRVSLCQGALDEGPARCFKAIRTLKVTHSTGMRDLILAIDLCQQAQSSTPADCFESTPKELELFERVLLCQKAMNKSPAECSMRGYRTLPSKAIVLLCQGLLDIAPPLPSLADKVKQKYQLNKLSSKSQESVNYYKNDESFGGPSDCGVAAMKSGLFGYTTNHEEISTLLNILCKNGDIRAVEQCLLKDHLIGTGALGAHLPLSSKVRLCSGATSEVQARCASAAGRTVSAEHILVLCRHATSVTPGACANHLVRHEMKQLTAPMIESCRTAISIPYHLHIERMWWDGGELTSSSSSTTSTSSKNNDQGELADTRGHGLFSRRTVHVLLSISNQFKWPLSNCLGCEDQNKSIIFATTSIPKSGGLDANGAIGDLTGLKTNTSFNGLVEFHALRFTASGEYDLRFHLSRNSGENDDDDRYHDYQRMIFGENRDHNLATQLIRVKVESHEDDGLGPLGHCGRSLYNLLSSSSLTQHQSNMFDHVNGIGLTEEVALILSSSSIQALSLFPPLLLPQSDQLNHQSNESSSSSTTTTSSSSYETCASKLTSAGIKLLSSWGGGLFVRYKPVVFALDKGEGLPDSVSDPCERLGLQCGGGSGGSSNHHTEKSSIDVFDDKYSHSKRNMPSARQVRSAYYRASLLWHPDRWASFSESFQRAAQDQFELISEAYRALGGGSSSKKKKENKNEMMDVSEDPSEVLYL